MGAAVSAWRVGRQAAARMGTMVALLVFVQLAVGALNMVLLAPVWMQIVHLLIADLLWVALVILTLEAGCVTASEV
jgi:heme A synthase